MRIKQLRTLLVLTLGTAATTALQATTLSFGNGSWTSFFVIESPNIPVRVYEINYDPEAPDAPKDGFDLLEIADENDDAISVDSTQFSFGVLVNAITFNSLTETNTGSPTFSPFWVHSVAGGTAGFDGTSSGGVNSIGTPQPLGIWTSGLGLSAPNRTIVDGSWDALAYGSSSATPSIQPIPEPLTGVLLLISCGFAATLRKRNL